MKGWQFAYKRVHKDQDGRYWSAFIKGDYRLEYIINKITTAPLGSGIFCLPLGPIMHTDGNATLLVEATGRILLPPDAGLVRSSGWNIKPYWQKHRQGNIELAYPCLYFKHVRPIKEETFDDDE